MMVVYSMLFTLIFIQIYKLYGAISKIREEMNEELANQFLDIRILYDRVGNLDLQLQKIEAGRENSEYDKFHKDLIEKMFGALGIQKPAPNDIKE